MAVDAPRKKLHQNNSLFHISVSPETSRFKMEEDNSRKKALLTSFNLSGNEAPGKCNY